MDLYGPWRFESSRAHREALRGGARFAPHQLRHAHAVEMAREGVSLNVIQRQLGHANLGITSVYLEGIDNAEIIDAVHARRPPMPRHRRPAPVAHQLLSATHNTRGAQTRSSRDAAAGAVAPLRVDVQ